MIHKLDCYLEIEDQNGERKYIAKMEFDNDWLLNEQVKIIAQLSTCVGRTVAEVLGVADKSREMVDKIVDRRIKRLFLPTEILEKEDVPCQVQG